MDAFGAGGIMVDINEIGMIYYGTKVENLKMILGGITKPLERNEQYISVSISGYKGIIPLNVHEDLIYLGSIYKKEYNAMEIDDLMYGKWKIGYKNSLTYIDGFGPNNEQFYNSFGEKKENNRKGKNITLILGNSIEIAYPEKIGKEPFEYYSLALHSFVKEIKLENILGIICDKNNINEVNTEISKYRELIQIYDVDEL